MDARKVGYVKNQRKEALHQFSTALVQDNAAMFVGDVSSAKFIKTKKAKSTLDAGWPSKTNFGFKPLPFRGIKSLSGKGKLFQSRLLRGVD